MPLAEWPTLVGENTKGDKKESANAAIIPPDTNVSCTSGAIAIGLKLHRCIEYYDENRASSCCSSAALDGWAVNQEACCVELVISTNNDTVIRAIVIFAEQLFENESKLVHPKNPLNKIHVPITSPKSGPLTNQSINYTPLPMPICPAPRCMGSIVLHTVALRCCTAYSSTALHAASTVPHACGQHHAACMRPAPCCMHAAGIVLHACGRHRAARG